MPLSANEISTYAKSAGFTGDEIKVATAIALAESGGNPKAHNAVPPDDSYGLWQINMLGTLGPSRRKTYGLNANTDLYDPATNARVAYGIYKGSGFKAWTTYTRGTYKKYLDVAAIESTSAAVGSSMNSAIAASTFNPINGVSGAINAFGETLFKTGANIGGIILAVTLLILGVLLLARNQVMNVLPTGKAAKIAKGVLSK